MNTETFGGAEDDKEIELKTHTHTHTHTLGYLEQCLF